MINKTTTYTSPVTSYPDYKRCDFSKLDTAQAVQAALAIATFIIIILTLLYIITRIIGIVSTFEHKIESIIVRIRDLNRDISILRLSIRSNTDLRPPPSYTSGTQGDTASRISIDEVDST